MPLKPKQPTNQLFMFPQLYDLIVVVIVMVVAVIVVMGNMKKKVNEKTL